MINGTDKVAYALIEYEGQVFKIDSPVKFEDGINFQEFDVECKQSNLVGPQYASYCHLACRPALRLALAWLFA